MKVLIEISAEEKMMPFWIDTDVDDEKDIARMINKWVKMLQKVVNGESVTEIHTKGVT